MSWLAKGPGVDTLMLYAALRGDRAVSFPDMPAEQKRLLFATMTAAHKLNDTLEEAESDAVA